MGPQFSLATHTDSDLRGPDWGAGAAGVVVGNITENLAFAGIVGKWVKDGLKQLITKHHAPKLCLFPLHKGMTKFCMALI